ATCALSRAECPGRGVETLASQPRARGATEVAGLTEVAGACTEAAASGAAGAGTEAAKAERATSQGSRTGQASPTNRGASHGGRRAPCTPHNDKSKEVDGAHHGKHGCKASHVEGNGKETCVTSNAVPTGDQRVEACTPSNEEGKPQVGRVAPARARTKTPKAIGASGMRQPAQEALALHPRVREPPRDIEHIRFAAHNLAPRAQGHTKAQPRGKANPHSVPLAKEIDGAHHGKHGCKANHVYRTRRKRGGTSHKNIATRATHYGDKPPQKGEPKLHPWHKPKTQSRKESRERARSPCLRTLERSTTRGPAMETKARNPPVSASNNAASIANTMDEPRTAWQPLMNCPHHASVLHVRASDQRHACHKREHIKHQR
ncbi:hypothetical protein V6N12_031774, partial [Hibiscus sabdariffa]